ncbi:MucR family transcriptional regulator [Rhizobium glycinendophyticum]|uniref:MucR family transcriptional regulator n=1 Tax=Rhizobium glycinendophyticum TaxID=2589807 RepID=A0A504UBC9_9HYPH|nr:MucR family transcriptional regulator [Rhizobium glycinendophyticum]TPP06946.1 MucR family transcriptional regulator [Rhizobium glycinendophyticum]
MQRDLLPEELPEGAAEDVSPANAVALTVNLVRAYVTNHIVPPAQLASLLEQTHRTVLGLSNLKPEPLEDTVSVDAQGGERLVCLECGKAFRALKRHLSAQHQLTPEAYRMRWNLPPDYPVTSPVYAAQRSDMAKATGLGKRQRGRPRKPRLQTGEEQT